MLVGVFLYLVFSLEKMDVPMLLFPLDFFHYLQVKIQACPGSLNDHEHLPTHLCSCGCFSFHSSFLGHVVFI